MYSVGVVATLFVTESAKYLERTKDLVACPTCLAESDDDG